MATKPTFNLKDLLKNPVPMSGGINMNIGGVSTPATIFKGTPAPAFQPMPAPARAPVLPAPVAAASAPVRAPIAAAAPAPLPLRNPNPAGFESAAPGAPAAPAAPAKSEIPAQWRRADGSIKTPEEIAGEIAGTLKASAGTADVGRLALNEFNTADKSVTDLRTDARRIGNTRNDIAVGETDPYKVASDSGIAYTPAELKAIENAYAGIYDPALDSALSKVEAKQASDKAAAAAAADENNIRLKAELDASAPYTLGKDQVRYGADGKPIAVGISDTPTGTTTYVAGANPAVDAFVAGIRAGTYKPSDIPDEYKAQVAQGMQATRPAISKSSTEAVSLINQIVGSDILGQISGIPNVSTFLPGTKAQTLLNLTKQLKGVLSLQNRDQLKGSGAISDFEFRVLGDASSALGIGDGGRTNLSQEEFVNELNKLSLKLQVGETELTDDELLFLQDKGYTPEQIREYNQKSFSGVGNTTASTGTGNRPQRNNNPGNVKAGGLADSLAVGKDDQDHLIFPDAEAGFKALSLDLTAKINGKSRYLPANPTIAQLGKVYAEDPNWPKKVAMMVGVGVNTPTTTVPFDKLVKAIATQEGFYAKRA